MAPKDRPQLVPGRARRPRRTKLFRILGTLSLLTICLFAAHLPGLQRFTTIRPFRPMTSSGPDTTPLPHHQNHPDGQPPKEDERHHKQTIAEFLQSLLDHGDPSKMAFGTNKHPPFKDDPPLLVGDLPAEHIPSYTPPSPSPTDGPDRGDGENKTGKRLIIVGDVHGHLEGLQALLRKVGFNRDQGDHLVLVGDIVTKGPDSKGVVALAMELGASAVRGNQDDKVLAAAREMHRVSEEGGDGEVDADMRKDHAHRVARSLSRDQLDWLKSLPIILRIGQLPDATAAPWNASTLVVVHGGLVPGVPLEKQDPWAVMNMRSLMYPGRKKPGKKKGPWEELAADGIDTPESEESSNSVAVPISGHEGDSWSRAWSRQQNHLPPSSAHTLAIYGHDARAGLQISRKVDISPYRPPFRSLSSSGEDDEDEDDEVDEEDGEDDDDDDDDDENDQQEKTVQQLVVLPGTDTNNPPTTTITTTTTTTTTHISTANAADTHPNDYTNPNEQLQETKHKKKKKKPKKEMGLRYAFGLDSGCGHGKHLTALVINATAEGVVENTVVQVKCRW